MRKKLFSFDSEVATQRNTNSPRKPIGFSVSDMGDTKGENDFFEIGTKEAHPQKKNVTKKEPTKNLPRRIPRRMTFLRVHHLQIQRKVQ